MNISKLTHEKLLAAIHHQETDAQVARECAEAQRKRADEAEHSLAIEKRASGIAAIRIDLAENKVTRLREERRMRDETIVQLSIRLAAYGDPPTMAQTMGATREQIA